MKKIILVFALAVSGIMAAQNFEISTLRIGDFKIFMPRTEAEKIAKKTLKETTDWEKPEKVNYFGETVEILTFSNYVGENQPSQIAVYTLKTKSKKFRTKSGIGVGNTRDDLINAYRNYPNFSVSQYKDPESLGKVESYFSLDDFDAGTYLSFRMENNIIVEVTVSVNEGC